MVLTYLVFILPLSRPCKHLLLGLLFAAAALVVYTLARRRGTVSANRAAPIAIVTGLMLPLLAANLLVNLNIATLYIWVAYLLLFAAVSIVWAKRYG